MNNRRGFRWAVSALVVACAVSACGGGMSAAAGTKKAKDLRTSTAQAYWKARNALPATLHLDAPSAEGAFLACTKNDKNGKGAAKYDIADYLQPLGVKMTMTQLLSGVKSALGPQGWTFASTFVPDSAMPDPANEKLHMWVARQKGVTIQLTLHEQKGTEPAAGYLDVLSTCQKYGKAQKGILAKYTSGSNRDEYRPTASVPHPIPTGFPTPGL